ncbi:glycosyltransferase family 2 protein [Ornithinibacillus sp. 179-J 7C1 HS]|uniref:glycosyltransferase family 2 protein n=1 Tax=Ornithinibacillus sp. 179-J 7C1 HS TaxID=3142384 RepID=UPI0039A032BB
MDSPFVTVFMPVYNCEKYIKDSLESILNQTYKNMEILLVNDGSTDNTVHLIEQYDDNRIRLIHNPQNMGIPYTRNIGLKEAKGKYMMIMDSDDIALPNRVEKQVEYLESHHDIDAIGTNYIRFTGSSEKKIAPTFTSPEAMRIKLLYFSPISNPSSAIRLETLKKHNITYNEEFFVAQDYELWTQLSKVGKLTILPEFLLYYRTGHENITKKSNEEKLQKRKELISKIRGGLLAYYGIHFTDEELLAYNEFFVHNYGAKIRSKETVIQTINKMKRWNANENTSLDRGLFIQILDDSIRIALSNHDISFMEKLKLFRELVTNKTIKNIGYILVKHVYYRLKAK